MATLAYMVVILFTWMSANFQGYLYFSAGEPILPIKYFEWILGIIGILVIPHYIKQELHGN